MGDRVSSLFTRLGLRSPRARRTGPRRPRKRASLREILRRDEFAPGVLIALLLALACTLVIGLGRRTPTIVPGRVANETITVRVAFELLDEGATERQRELARSGAPLVYGANELAIEQIERTLRTLPTALAVAETLDQVAPEYREPFGLSHVQFEEIKREASGEGEASARWEARVNRLMRRLDTVPLLGKDEIQRILSSGAQQLELRAEDGEHRVAAATALNIQAEDAEAQRRLVDELTQIAESAGFYGPRAEVVVQRLSRPGEATFLFDREGTAELRERLAKQVSPVIVRYREGDVLVRRGELVSDAASALVRRESGAFRVHRAAWLTMVRWAGVAGFALLIVGAFVAHLALFDPRVLRNPWRFTMLSVLIAGGASGAVWVSSSDGSLTWGSMMAAATFIGMMTVVAYDLKMALVVAGVLTLVSAAALRLEASVMAAVMFAVWTAAWQLRDLRNRGDVVRAGVVTALVAALAVVITDVIRRPLVGAVWTELLQDALQAAGGGFLAGAMTLVLLPTVERLFGIVTGMTLSEWRDPRNPLLRELQARAPGTFNHSHMVATLAEAAADAIGADSLHVYVGALYHDIGKMNKPEYFVENQLGGANKHNKLSPAMSLLVIVGHVKDGIELAREYGLPKSLHHYIEAHHGTTLVEYFFDQAKRQAEDGEPGDRPSEVEYRYPGPKPRTKEAAILMICDAVESATRAMSEPTPSRIGTLVHHLAIKRLMDGQLDDCNLTLGELSRIEDAVTRALRSIYHGRIAYPSDTKDAREKTAAPAADPRPSARGA